LVTIATVSSITIIPLLYWTVAGMSVGYAGMVRRKLRETPLVVLESPYVLRRMPAGARSRVS